jgi:putative transposase
VPVLSFESFLASSVACGGGELWEDGYFVRTVGDKVTAEIIRRYIQYHQGEKSEAQQLSLFD